MDSLNKILMKQSGFADSNILEARLLIELTVAWCLEKNRRYLFSHQATKEILKDFEIEQPDPKLDQPRKL